MNKLLFQTNNSTCFEDTSFSRCITYCLSNDLLHRLVDWLQLMGLTSQSIQEWTKKNSLKAVFYKFYLLCATYRLKIA